MLNSLVAFAMLSGIALTCAAQWPALGLSPGIGGALLWCASLLRLPHLARRNLIQSLLLAGLGLIGALWGMAHGVPLSLSSLFSANATLVAMVVSVSFLALIAKPVTLPPSAGQSIGSTLLGVHLFGSVINLSAAFMFGDRMERNGRITLGQSLLLSRASTIGAFWSPFYASMAVGLSVAPQANLFSLIVHGVPLALAALLLTYWQLRQQADSLEVSGVPVSFTALALPFLMAMLVLGWHFLQPTIPVLTVITLSAPAFATLVLACRTRGQLTLISRKLREHATTRLPRMGNEVLLFLCAGWLTVGGKAVVASLGGWQLFSQFGAPQAMLMFVATVLLAILGLHPIVGISLFASVMGGESAHPSLMAMTAICAWGVGTAVGPLSGINLALFGRYGVDTYAISRHTLCYALAMSVLVCAMLGWFIR